MTQSPMADGPGSPSWELVETILQARLPLALACTGGGSRAISWLLNHPGASRAVIEAQVPYHSRALSAYLPTAGPHAVTEDTARGMALVARDRAAGFSEDVAALGAGVTAALATDRDRRGDDRAFVVVRGRQRYEFTSLQFDRQAGRLAQEDVLSAAVLNTLVSACQDSAPASQARIPVPAWARTVSCSAVVDEFVEALLAERVPAVEIRGAAAEPARSQTRSLLVPGSFNPLHDGHLGLAAAAERASGREAAFELSVRNVDKPPLPYRQIMERAAQPRQGRSLILTREPTFAGKARQLPGCWFAIGFDTAVRLVDPAYYDGAADGMRQALQSLRDLGSRFLVAGRQWQGDFRGLQDVHIPTGFEDLFTDIPQAEFRLDVSSTALRAERTAG